MVLQRFKFEVWREELEGTDVTRQDMHTFFQFSASPLIAKSLLGAVSGMAGRMCPCVQSQQKIKLWSDQIQSFVDSVHGAVEPQEGRKEHVGDSVSAAHHKNPCGRDRCTCLQGMSLPTELPRNVPGMLVQKSVASAALTKHTCSPQ